MQYGKEAKKKENNENIFNSWINLLRSWFLKLCTNKNFNRKNTEERRVRGKPREVSTNTRYPGSDMSLELMRIGPCIILMFE